MADSKPIQEQEFIKQICSEIKRGGRMTPFLGSGISAQSGIIMGDAFPKYLAWSVYRVIEQKWNIRSNGWPPYPSDQDAKTAHNTIFAWFKDCCERQCLEPGCDSEPTQKVDRFMLKKARDLSWAGRHTPHFTRPLIPEILRADKIWDKETQLESARKAYQVVDAVHDETVPKSSEEYLKEAAVRALSHWTRTLEFLASVAISDKGHVYMDELDQSVIDAFNAHITRGKRPNLIHNMISRLARSLRTRAILTTNFDTLIEQSYEAQGEPLHVLAVSIEGGLPSFATVRAQDCVVKLHGDILETRADSSINEPPTPKDMERFFQYLRGPKHPQETQPWDFVPSHLLVLGYSASDARCVQMIRFVLDMDPAFRVFWVCHTKNDFDKITRLFGCYNHKEPRVMATQTERSDLLLWELYQRTNLSLPGGGYSLQFTHHVPPSSSHFEREPFMAGTEIEGLYEVVKDKTAADAGDAGKIVYIDCSSGTAQPLQAVFQRFKTNRYQAAWFELEDYRNVDDLYFNILSVVSLSIGFFQLEWINFMPQRIHDRADPDKRLLRLRLLVEKFKIDPQRWVFFFYGRNGAGGCTGWEDNVYWKPSEVQRCHALIEQLRTLKFRIVYMPRGEKRLEGDQRKINEKLISGLNSRFGWKLAPNELCENLIPDQQTYSRDVGPAFCPLDGESPGSPLKVAIDTWHAEQKKDGRSTKQPEFKKIIESVLGDFATNTTNFQQSTRALWLYGLTLFRQSRHPAAMISEAVFPCPWRFNMRQLEATRTASYDNDEFRHSLIFGEMSSGGSDGWLGDLEKSGLFLRKPGGYAWMYRDTRLMLQRILEKIGPLKFHSTPFDEGVEHKPGYELKSLSQVRPRLHYWIGDWYLRAFYATGHFIPWVEAVYHSVQALKRAQEYQWKTDKDTGAGNMQQITLAWRAICQTRKLLLVGRRSLLFWCPGVDVEQFYLGTLAELKPSLTALFDKMSPTALARRGQMAIESLEREISHLKRSVENEGVAHGGRTAPYFIQISQNTPIETSWEQDEQSQPVDTGDNEEWLEKMCLKINQFSEQAGIQGQDVKLSSSDEITELFGSSKRRAWIETWARESADESLLFQMIWMLSELMYRLVRRAKLLYHSRSTGEADHILVSAKDAGVAELWVAVCSLGYESLQMCRYLSPEHHAADCDLRIRLLTVYALALGYLERFSEANRRLNEAHAVIISGMGWADARELARIHIRRAELLVWQARQETRKVNTHKKSEDKPDVIKGRLKSALAWMDDAWAALERGELCLGGASHSAHWWYRLLTLKLSCYATLGMITNTIGESPKEVTHSLPFRRRIHLKSALTSLLRDGLIVGAGDVFRQVRVLEYAFLADEKLHDPSQRLFRAPTSDPEDDVKKWKEQHPELLEDIRRVLHPVSAFQSKKSKAAQIGKETHICLIRFVEKWKEFDPDWDHLQST